MLHYTGTTPYHNVWTRAFASGALKRDDRYKIFKIISTGIPHCCYNAHTHTHISGGQSSQEYGVWGVSINYNYFITDFVRLVAQRAYSYWTNTGLGSMVCI